MKPRAEAGLPLPSAWVSPRTGKVGSRFLGFAPGTPPGLRLRAGVDRSVAWSLPSKKIAGASGVGDWIPLVREPRHASAWPMSLPIDPNRESLRHSPRADTD